MENSFTSPISGEIIPLSLLKQIDTPQLACKTGGHAPPLRYLYGGRKSAPT